MPVFSRCFKILSQRTRFNKLQLPANSIPPHLVNTELKQQRRLRKRHLKSVFVLLQTLSSLSHRVNFVKSWRIFRELNSKGLYQ